MDFINELKEFSLRATKLKDQIFTEEATKMSLIIPFFSFLAMMYSTQNNSTQKNSLQNTSQMLG